MTDRSLDRRLAMLSVDLDDLKQAAKSVGGTVNDAFVAAVTGGLRRYHEHHGAPVEDLRITLPISIRKEDDPPGGNRITLERFAVPVGLADPAERIRRTGERCRAARDDRALPLSDAIAGTLNLLPSNVVGSMLKHVDFLASNVPGVTCRSTWRGLRSSGYFVFGPTTGSAVNVTLLTYCQNLLRGFNIDAAAVPDHDVLMDCFRQGFEESSRASGRPPSGRSAIPRTGWPAGPGASGRRVGEAGDGQARDCLDAIYGAVVAATVLIAIDLPHPTNLAVEGHGVLFTLLGVGTGVALMRLAASSSGCGPSGVNRRPLAAGSANNNPSPAQAHRRGDTERVPRVLPFGTGRF